MKDIDSSPLPEIDDGASDGATFVEYLLLAATLIFIAIVSVKFFGEQVSTQWSEVTNTLNTVFN